MKKALLFLLVIASISANGQSLKDALYSGKLRNDSNSVIKKGDDLSTKIDTTTKTKPVEVKAATTNTDSTQKSITTTAATAVSERTGSESLPAAETKTTGPDHKNNNKVFKAYIDSLSTTIQTEVLSNKKIKKGTYYFYVDYEIGVDGNLSINNVTVAPENETLQNQVKDRLIMTAPQLAPVPDSSGKPRAVKRKYNFNVTKD